MDQNRGGIPDPSLYIQSYKPKYHCDFRGPFRQTLTHEPPNIR